MSSLFFSRFKFSWYIINFPSTSQILFSTNITHLSKQRGWKILKISVDFYTLNDLLRFFGFSFFFFFFRKKCIKQSINHCCHYNYHCTCIFNPWITLKSYVAIWYFKKSQLHRFRHKSCNHNYHGSFTHTISFNLKRKQTECLRHQTKSQYLSLVWRLTDNSSLAILHFFLVSWSFLWLLTMTTSCFLWLLQRSGRMEVSLRVLTRVWFWYNACKREDSVNTITLFY